MVFSFPNELCYNSSDKGDGGVFMLFLMMLIDSEEDRSKFELIYKSYRNLMFYIAKIILGSDADAEDAVQ